MRWSFFPALTFAALFFTCSNALAQDNGTHVDDAPTSRQESAVEHWWNGPYLSGNWGGGRTWLEERGVRLDLNYVNNVAANPVGGRRQGVTYADNLHFGLVLDTDPMLGWPGGRFTVSGLNRAGESLTTDFIGNQYNVQQVYGGQTTMLYGLNFEQRLLSNRLSVKGGRFAASDDFNSSPVYGLYMNHGINGFVRNVQLNTQYSVYPFATWALRVIIEPSPWFDIRVGAFQNSPNVFNPEEHGVNFGFGRDDGILVAGQVGFTARADAATARAEPHGTPTGHYWIGTTVSHYEYSRFDGLAPETLSYGFYAHADQLVWREPGSHDEGLTLWAAGGYYPQNEISIVPVQVNGGVLYKGLFGGRSEDILTVGAIYGAFGSSYARSRAGVVGAEAPTPTHELVLELGYKLALRRFFFVQPNLQYISRPAGTGVIDDAFVVGLQSGVVL